MSDATETILVVDDEPQIRRFLRASLAMDGFTIDEADTGAAALAVPTDGPSLYDTACTACHGQGIGGAPKFGDKAAWGPRIAQGNDTLYTHALKGFQGKAGMMPAKGGNAGLADADVKAAVDYMVSKAK